MLIHKYCFIIFLAIASIGIFWGGIIRGPWGIQISFVAAFIMYIGEVYRNIKESKCLQSDQFGLPVIVLLGVMVSALIIKNGYVNFRTATYAIAPLTILNICVLSILILTITKRLVEIESIFLFVTVIIHELKYVGGNSIIYLCLNQLLIESIKQYFTFFPKVLGGMLVFSVVMIVLRILSIAITKTNAKVLIGRF